MCFPPVYAALNAAGLTSVALPGAAAVGAKSRLIRVYEQKKALKSRKGMPNTPQRLSLIVQQGQEPKFGHPDEKNLGVEGYTSNDAPQRIV